MNSMSVHTDCVEDVDTLLADICFNEDLYAKPPTVEFTVTDQNALAGDIAEAKLRRSSTTNIPSSSSSSNNNSSDNHNNSSNSNSSSSISTFVRDSSALLSSSSSGSSSSSSSSSSSGNSSSGNSSSGNSSSGNSSSGNSGNSRSEILATATTPNTRFRKVRTPMTEPAPKNVYSSIKEIPIDHEEDKDITVYISGRNRVVYYGINGSPYYITDSGKKNKR